MSLADRIASLAPEQRALFEKLVQKQQKATRAPAPPPIPRVSGPRGEGDWPLSLDQERYWFLEQLYPDGAGLNISAATRIRGPLVVPFLAAALHGVIHRHAAWRTTFPVVDGRDGRGGRPVQRVAAERTQLVPVLDLSALPTGRREEEAARRATADAAAAFDLARGPLVRASLVRMSATDHLCLLTVHHLVTDFLSFQIAWGEVAAIYAALAAGRPGGVEALLAPPLLPALPVQYADFAVWQRGWLTGEVLAELTSWWREQLADFPLALELPTDRPRPAAPRLLGGRREVAVPVGLTAALRALGREAGATVFMSVLAATAALLHRDSGQEKLILGANNANRNRPEIEPVVGCFLTQVPFALDLSGDPTFRGLLARVRRSALGAYAHQDLPFGQLVQAIDLRRDPSRQPLVQALVQVLDGQPGKVRLAGIELAPVDAYDGRARYDLMLSLFDDPQAGLAGSLEYDVDLFDATTVERQIERLLLQIAAAVADPALRLSALPVLSAAARHQALREWSDTAAPLPDWTAPERFAAQAARTPEALAVVAGDETLTYADLDHRATDLARRLQAAGVGPGSRVALLLDRTVDLPVAIFGVWKAGGAYVPLDLAAPAGRLADLLADIFDLDEVGPAVVVHRGALPLALVDGMRSLDLAAPQEPLEAADRPLPDRHPGELAYLLYTSGTTGRPKAVMVEHGHLAAVLGAYLDRYGLGPGDRSPHLSRYTFDASLLEIVPPLLVGAALEILTTDEILDPAALRAALARATRFVGVPAVLRQVAAAAAGESGRELAAGLRTMAVGGEAMSPEFQTELLATFPHAELDAVYGPTETTIMCTAHRVSRPAGGDRRGPSERSLIGRPLPGVETWVVDPRGEPVPLGVPGELWIGGPGVARGYFRRPELSAERFVEREGRRFYRLGDLVRQVPALGGSLEFLGRIDLQVKVRGIRIEPGEIEATLVRHPAVREAVVVARPGLPGHAGDRRLVAYVVPAASETSEASEGVPEELRAFLRTLLPEALVPSVFVLLPKLPLQTSGKVDRRALPEPETAGATSAILAGNAAATPPRNAREERLAEIWRAVLGRERVGVHDNFFQLGGDSILSIQVVARVRQAGLLLTPKLLFENQTIAELAARMTVATAPVDAAGEDTVTGEAPLTPVQHRFFAAPRRQPERFNQAVLLAVREKLARAPLAAALERLAAHHDALRLRFVHEEGGWRQIHAAATAVPLLEIDLAALSGEERRGALEAAAEELQSGLNFGHMGHMDRGPLFTAALFRQGSEAGDRLLLTAHHLVVDGVSWRVLVEDLTVAYRQLAAGLEAVLPAKTTSWKRWAELLAAYARSPELAAELPAWFAVPPVSTLRPLPVDRTPETLETLATVSAELGEEETRALLQAVPEVYRTEVNDLLLTALARAFSVWSGDDALLVDLEGHGREEIFPGVDLSRTVGWFTTVYPVALALPPGGDPRAAIRAVKERLRAVPSHGLGYGLLRYLADPATGERLAALPAPQVSFNYLGQLDSSLPEGGLFTLAPEPVRGTAGPAADNAVGRPLFAIDSLVLGERLRVSLTYDPRRHLQTTAERLAAGFVAELRALVAHCLSPAAGGVTPSDFPLARLDPAALDRLLGEGREQRQVEDLYPLAPLQQGILFHSLYTAGSELYFEQLTATLDGALDLAAFKRAWQRVVERHAALRTIFLWRGVEAPLQLVRRNVELPWTIEDWRDPESVDSAGRWREYLAADRARGFDLGDRNGAPLLRLGLARIGEARHLLVWSFHHLLLDGWCFSLLLSEVFALYEAFRQPGGREPLLPRPRPYRDYIAWLGTRHSSEAEGYWRRTLQGFTVPTPLPFDHPAAPAGIRADDYAEQRLVLPPSRVAGLEAVAQRLRVTPNILVEGAWALLLSRYAQTSDVLFGHVVSGRPAELAGVETMVGLFINTLPVRVRVPEAGEEEVTAAAWLGRLQEGQFELRQHEWTPLARVQALSEVPAGEPLFGSLYVFENYPVDPAVGERLGELRIEEVASTERTNYPLTLAAAARGDLTLSLTADRRFELATVRRMLGHLANLLAGIAADPERPPQTLPLLSEAERHQLTVEWNDTGTVLGRDLEPVPIGIPGELYAGGAAGARLYRTGDFVRFLPDGSLEFLGHPDRQAAPSAGERYRAPRTEIEERLAAIWRTVLRRERVGIDDSFFELGGDSILSIQVVARARQAGLDLTPRQLFEQPTIAALAALPEIALLTATTAAEQGAVEGEVPLTPIQRSFLASGPADPHHFNQSLLLLLPPPLGPEPLAGALAAVVSHHDALRLRFPVVDEEWRPFNAAAEPASSLTLFDLSALPPALRSGALETAAAALQGGFDLARGPLFRAARFVFDSRAGGEPDRLLLVAHHLVIDGVSWRVLLEDLRTAYGQLAAGDPMVTLPAKTTSFKRWAERLAAAAREEATLAELPYWLGLPTDVRPLPRDGDPGAGPAGPAGPAGVTVSLERAATRALLGEAGAAYHTEVNDLLLTALAQAFAEWTQPLSGESRLRLDLEGHGRQEVGGPGELLDLSRTVGWFTAIFPVVLDIPAPVSNTGPATAIRAVKRALRALPRHGLGYGLLRELAPPETAAKLAAIPTPEVAFNYLGQLDGTLGGEAGWGLAPESAGPDQSPRAGPRHPIEINAWVLDGELQMAWTYDLRRQARSTIERLARGFLAALARLVAHCVSPEAGGFTPSDFPLARLAPAALDALAGVDAALDRTIEDVYPLAPLQAGMLFQSLYAPDSDLYFEHLTASLSGPLDVAAFAAAWQRVLDRHPALRTAFVWDGLERPLQVVRRGMELPWTYEDWRHSREVPRSGLAARLAAWMAADRARPFDLGRAPLLRVALFHTGPDEHRFVWSFHHILLDGWCLSLVLGEVFSFYRAAVLRSAGSARSEVSAAAPPPARPYREFLAWLATQDGTAAERYFRQALAGFAEPTRLPLDHPQAPAGNDGAPPAEELPLPPALAAGLAAFARARELTLSTLVHAAWALLLSRHGGEPDVVFGTVVSGRPAELPGVESMVGLFINTLPARLKADPGAALAAWLPAVQASLLALRQHETAALAEIQRASELPPGVPLFESFVAFENYPVSAALGGDPDDPSGPGSFGGLEIRDVTFLDRTGYPLVLAALPGREPGDLTLSVAFDRRTERATACRLLGQLATLLVGMADSATAPHAVRLADLPLLAAAERHQLLVEWGEGAPPPSSTSPPSPPSPPKPVHDEIAAQAALRPDAAALLFRGEILTYGELVRRSARLGGKLRAAGVTAESVVGLAVERCFDLAVGLLAIWQAGGAFLPLDPALPRERLDFLLADSAAGVLLTRERLRSRLPAFTGTVVDLAAAGEAAGDEEEGERAVAGVAGELGDLAYLIYTSGTTGRPKAVAVEHGNLARMLAGIRRELGFGERFGERERMPCLAPYSFDIFLFELLAPLTSGGVAELLSIAPSPDPVEVLAALSRATRFHAVPALMREVVAAAWREGFPAGNAGIAGSAGLRAVYLGGDAVAPDLLADLRTAFPATELRVLYGPTEGTILATTFPLRPLRDALPERPPLGRPLPGVAVRLLADGAIGKDTEPAPLGAPGELLLGGIGVARGYLGRPELTAERFVTLGGRRWYRTGDRARFLPDGQLEFLGRADDQVKVRGFRIELGEIEAVLARDPRVAAAVVLARETRRGDGDRRLVAYVVPPPGQTPATVETADLAAALARELPAYMVPTVFVVLPELPLTPHGKVNRAALPAPPAPGAAAGRSAAAKTAPRTPTEATLAAHWREVLGVPEVYREDHFFALGGYSLLATQLVSRMRAAFALDLPLRILFERPVLADLAAVLAAAVANSHGAPGACEMPIPHLETAGDRIEAPLSFAQERLWFIDRLSGTSAYNLALALTLEGDLVPAALEAALGKTVRRHGALRTTFALRGDTPVQVVSPASLWVLPRVDLSALSRGAGAAELYRLAAEDARRPFDLARGPLLRATLLRTEPEAHTLLLAMHHIVSDGWSMGIVVREVMPLYRAALGGHSSPLPPLALQYTDFAIWQRRWLAGEVLAEQLDYWRRTLDGAPADLALPFDRPRPARQSYRGARLSFPLAEETARALKNFLAGAEATLFMGLLAAFQALLARSTGEDDIAVGSPIANRVREELTPLVGFFVNTVVLRARFDGGLTFRGLLERVRETALGAYAHQDLPFERLVEELAPERSLGRTPLFQVMFAVENTPMGSLDLPGLRLNPVPVDLPFAQFDLSLNVRELTLRSGLAADLEYSTDLFHPTTAMRLAGHFETLLAAALETPDRRLAELPLLSAAERGQLLREWNDTRRDFGGDLPEVPLHRWVEARAAAAPDALAVLAADSGASLTYGELARRAGRLARRLRDRGVGPESRIALDTERSPDLVVAMLAVLKAGGAYVPIEPGTPAARVDRLLADSGATLLLRAEQTGEANDLSTSAISATVATAAGLPAAAAYVIYTSGSTGSAKGVVVSQRSVSRYARRAAERYQLRPGDRLLQFSSLGFDTSVDEIWSSLTAGATLVLRSDEMAGTLPRFVAEVERLGITVLSLPTAFWHELSLGLAEGAEVAVRVTLPPAVRLTVIGGEEAQPQRLADWRAGTRRSGSLLVNAYGPTEATIAAAFATLAAAGTTCTVGEAGQPVSLGRPMDGARLHGVDRDLQLVPIGVWGELLIGGTGVARGYLGRPDLTAERFLPDAWGDEPGGRVYRTGDRVRLRGDGELLFGGRLDQQVKIRGFRIEPGEIEAALMDHPSLAAAVVVTRRAGGGDYLVAGIVPVAGAVAPSPEDLRAFLGERLPAPMIPAAFAVLPELPLTPNGKVDRRAIARLETIGAMGAERPAGAATAPRTALEVHLAQVWSEVLGIRTVARDDSFFALGGHSLAATRLVARLAAGLGVAVPLTAIFEAPTLGAMAERIERLVRAEAAKSGAKDVELPLVLWRGRGEESAPLSFAQERLWFVDRLRPGNTAFNMPSPFLLRGRLDLPALERAVLAVRRRQGSLRTTFVTGEGSEGVPVQVIAPAGAPGSLPRIDLDALPAPRRYGEAERLAAEDAARPFDLERGPLFRPLVVRLGASEHLLLLTCHHIISDGWSAGVLVRDLTAYYAGGVGITGIAGAVLPDLPVQYADYAVWQRERFSGAVLDEQIDYWRRQLAGVSPLDLPTDRPRRAIPTLRGATRAFRLGAVADAALAGIAREQGATLFMALHAGFAALLSFYTGRRDLPIGTPVAHRTRAELEGLIGFFINTLVLRADLSGDPEPTFPALVARSRQVALGAFSHQDLPFERLVDELGLPRDPYRPPLLRVLFQLQNAPDSLDTGLDLPGLSLAPFDCKTEGAKFDLVVNLGERDSGVEGELRYDADLFDGPTIERLAGHFERLLATWAADPDRPLSALSLLSAAERQQLLAEWNVGAPPRRCPSLLHRRFEAQVDRAPDALALGVGGERLTYGELDRQANRIAWHLLAEGIRPGDRVALSLERSAGMVAAILGVLKAGAAYVPLDPAQPAERLAFAREDSGAALLLTAADLDAARYARAESSRRLPVPADPAFPALPAYIIYTSGSTGRPKGVVVSHANVDRLFTVTAPTFGFDPGDAWTLFHSYAFDFSVWEIFGALLHGGRLVVVPYWQSRSPADFYRLLAEERITVLNQTPSAFHQLLWAEEAAPADLALREILFGGEALNPASLAPWFERHGDAVPRLVNMYGITETTVHVTLRPMRKADLERGSVLGKPLSDLSLHLLDDAWRPQPIGVPGEIHVGGAGLAQGYLSRPDLTAERFVPDPFSSEPGARLYRSGDLARRLPDGDLEYLGRIDHQVKLRGFRIELGEIEAALAARPGVREAVVLLRDGSPAPPHLVAYVVLAPEEAADATDAIDAAALRQHLADRLPEPMLPAAFVFLDALPLTVNGKVDRRALPAPEAVETVAARESVPPRTALERYLAEQFRAVLGIGPERAIGSDDDFFALGGTSISGAIFIHRLQETLGEIVHVVAIFDHPSVAALADYVRGQHGGAARRIWGEGAADGEGAAPGGIGDIGGIGGVGEVVGRRELAEMRRLVVFGGVGPAALPARVEPEPRNPPALFLLSPPRSGSTLLRVMLGAHPRLFAPPELELLSFRTMAERHEAFVGRDRFWLEGLVRAVMEAREVDAGEAERILGEAERQDWSTHRFYGELMSWLEGRMLVDKTPSYALDPAVLARAESGFAGARYLHLVRHPRATVRSFEEAKMEQIFFRRPHPFSRRQLAELVWTVSHENIRAFLAGVPEERFRTVHFEDLVREPDRVLAGICDFLGLDFHPEMAEPYRPGVAQMVDGPHAVSRMLGDVKFLGHGRVDPAAAERWREEGREAAEVPLGMPTRELARALGYPPDSPELAPPGRGVLVSLQKGSPEVRPLFCVHPVGGEVVAYRELALRLGPERPVYGLQSPERPVEDVVAMAALYLEAVRQAQPTGPYHLVGWSMGGVVAYEMARQLVAEGERVETLALLDTLSPLVWTAEPVLSDVDLVTAFALDLARLSGVAVPNVDLSDLDLEGALAQVLKLGRAAGVLAPGVELAELRRLFERFSANRRALATYPPLPYAGPVALFRAGDVGGIGDIGDIGDIGIAIDLRLDLGWGDLVTDLQIADLPGDHYSMLHGPGAAALAAAVRSHMRTEG